METDLQEIKKNLNNVVVFLNLIETIWILTLYIVYNNKKLQKCARFVIYSGSVYTIF